MLLASPAAWAQTDQEASLFIGYSYLNAGLEKVDSSGSHGVEIDYTYFLDRRVGFTLSASGHWGTLDAPSNAFGVARFDMSQTTFLVGPHLVLWRGLTSEGGFRLLAGAAWRKLDTASLGARVSDEVKFAGGASLNIDWRIGDRLWIRAPQPSVLFTRFGDDWKADFRIAVGIVIRAGELLQ
jgi:hypothetical protein